MSEHILKPGWQVWRFDQMATNVKDKIDRPVESGLARYVGLEPLKWVPLSRPQSEQNK
jgi:type I restriction enzyme S subunit